MTPDREKHFLLTQLKDHVVLDKESVLGFWKEHAPAPARKTAPSPVLPQGAPSPHNPFPENSLEGLRAEIGDCQRCPLGATRKKLVFGVGNPHARVMLIGEGPGYMEDRQGEPFVGPAGQLLDKILEAIGLSRKPLEPAWRWVYIANIVKCHPLVDASQPDKRGNDRPPAPLEIDTCFPFLLGQIQRIRPDFIVALGSTAAKVLLKTSRGISSLRGRWQDFNLAGEDLPPIRLMPTYHPAALLRDPGLKKAVWEDVKALRDLLPQTPS